MITHLLTTRFARPLAATALLALLTGCATCGKSAVGVHGGTRAGDLDDGIQLNAPGPHQITCLYEVKKGATILKIPVYSGPDDPNAKPGQGHTSYVNLTVSQRLLDARHVNALHTVNDNN